MNTKTAVRVISMKTAVARRARFEADASEAAIAWSFFDALRLPEAPLLHDEAATRVHTGRALRAGEIGCYASHYSVWDWFISSDNEQLVVFEDDVIVDWAALDVLCKRDLASDGIHVLKLYATHPMRSEIARYKLFSDHSHLMRVQGYCYGTQAYVLTRHGAKALLTSCGRLTMPIDWAMSRYWWYGVPNYAVFPFPVFERHGASTLGHTLSVSELATASDKALRFLWRLRDRLVRAWVDSCRARKPFGAPSDSAGPMFGGVP